MLAIGVMIWLGSELMFFSGLFAAFFTIRANTIGPWPPAGTDLDTLRAGIFTVDPGVVELHHAVGRVPAEWRKRQSARIWIVATHHPGRGVPREPGLRVAVQHHPLVHQRLRLALLHHVGPARPARLHRPVAMVFLLGRMRGDIGGDPGELSAFQGVSYYWHFVDIVWVGLFSCLFLLK